MTDDDDTQATFIACDLARRMEEMHTRVRGKPKRPRKRKGRVKTIGDCEQADVVDIAGKPYRIAFFVGETAMLYPAGDVAIKPDASNMLRIKKTESAKLWEK